MDLNTIEGRIERYRMTVERRVDAEREEHDALQGLLEAVGLGLSQDDEGDEYADVRCVQCGKEERLRAGPYAVLVRFGLLEATCPDCWEEEEEPSGDAV